MVQDTQGTQRPAWTRGFGFIVVMMSVLLAGCIDGGVSDDPVATDAVRIPGPWVFEPKVIEVTNGTTVTWTNDGGQAHTITIKDLDLDLKVDPGERTEYTFETPGTYEYVCRFHPPDMKGRVIVRAADADASGDAEPNLAI